MVSFHCTKLTLFVKFNRELQLLRSPILFNIGAMSYEDRKYSRGGYSQQQGKRYRHDDNRGGNYGGYGRREGYGSGYMGAGGSYGGGMQYHYGGGYGGGGSGGAWRGQVYGDQQSSQGEERESNGGRRRRRGRGRGRQDGKGGRGGDGFGGGPIGNTGRGRPPGLRGKEIGLWFAERGKARRKREEAESRHVVDIASDKEKSLNKLLHTIRSNDDVAPQPTRSYQDPNAPTLYSDAFEETEVKPLREKTHEGRYFSKKSSSLVEKYSSSETSRPSMDNFRSYDGGYEATQGPSRPNTSRGDRDTSSASRNAYDNLRRSVGNCDEEANSGKPIKVESTSDAEFIPLSTSGADFMPQSITVKEEKEDEEDEEEEDREKEKEMLRLIQDDEMDLDLEDMMNDDMDAEELDDSVLLSITEALKWEEGEDDFIQEFLSHNEANRRSTENLAGSGNVKYTPRNDRDPTLDTTLKNEHEQRQADPSPQLERMLQFRKKLPSYKMREEILDMVTNNQAVVISGETGCGKTTQVGQFILDYHIARGEGSMAKIVCTQPRRISAISVAERVADERGEKCGEASVGYQIRLEHKLPRKKGSLLFCTTGILLKWMAGDPNLTRANYVILDEIHERDLQSDFLMIILRDLMKRRSDLKVILMSATLNADQFSRYYGNCPMLNIPGFTFPVTEYLLEDVIEELKYLHNDVPTWRPRRRFHRGKSEQQMDERQRRMDMEVWVRNLPRKYSELTRGVLMGMSTDLIDIGLVTRLVEHITCQKPAGAILVFLPGWDDINKLHKSLTGSAALRTCRTVIIPLHSMMPTVNQRQVFDRPPQGVRKIVIATNIAETSITIDDIVYVVDCGKIKMKNFNPEENIATLMPEPVSRANAKQRRGRAGRVQPGECYHLYSDFQEKYFEDYQKPEMLRTRLEELCLQIKLLKLGKIVDFVQKAMQPPSQQALEVSIQLLVDLNALDHNEDLTPLGYHLAKMPVDPHTGKMLLFAAMFSCLDPVLTVAASLSFKDAFHIPLGKEKEADQKRRNLAGKSKSDHIMLVSAFKGWEIAKQYGSEQDYCWRNFLSANTLKMLFNMRNQFCEILQEMKFIGSKDPKYRPSNRNSGNTKLVKAILCAGLYPNVAKISVLGKHGVKLCTKKERKVKLHPKSVNESQREFESRWMIYHLKMKTSGIFLYDTTMVSSYSLLFFGGDMTFERDENGEELIVVDDWIKFRAKRSTAKLITDLRAELDKLLSYKITHPGVTNWNQKDKEGALLHAITDLIITEPDTSNR